MRKDEQCAQDVVVIRMPVRGRDKPIQVLIPWGVNLTEDEAREMVKAFRATWDFGGKTKAGVPPERTLREKYPDIFLFGRSNFTPESRSISSDRREAFYAEPEIKDIVAALDSVVAPHFKTYLLSYPKWLHRGRQVVKGSTAKYTERSTDEPVFTFGQTCPSLPQVLKAYMERGQRTSEAPAKVNQIYMDAMPASFSTDIFP